MSCYSKSLPQFSTLCTRIARFLGLLASTVCMVQHGAFDTALKWLNFQYFDEVSPFVWIEESIEATFDGSTGKDFHERSRKGKLCLLLPL